MSASARQTFRVLTRVRGGYGGGTLYDVQLESLQSGGLLWAQTFTDATEAAAYEERLTDDLEQLDDEAFRRKYRVPATA